MLYLFNFQATGIQNHKHIVFHVVLLKTNTTANVMSPWNKKPLSCLWQAPIPTLHWRGFSKCTSFLISLSHIDYRVAYSLRCEKRDCKSRSRDYTFKWFRNKVININYIDIEEGNALEYFASCWEFYVLFSQGLSHLS